MDCDALVIKIAARAFLTITPLIHIMHKEQVLNTQQRHESALTINMKAVTNPIVFLRLTYRPGSTTNVLFRFFLI